MKTTWALGAALLTLLLSRFPSPASGQELPAGAAKPAEDPIVTMTVKPSSFRGKAVALKLEGTARMMDGARLVFNLHRMEETSAAGSLNVQYIGCGSAQALVGSKKFSADRSVETWGIYQINAVFMEELQATSVLEAAKGKYAGMEWAFQVSAWNDEHLKDLSTRLLDMDELTNEALELVKKFEKGSASQQVWASEAKPLLAEMGKYLIRIQKSDVKYLYSATMNHVFFTVRNIQSSSPYFIWKDGEHAGAKDYHTDNTEMKTWRNEKFTYENIKRYISEAPALAGRELCLWIIKDVRRTGSLKPALAEILKQHAEHPGVAPYAERLKTLLPVDCDELEKAVRRP